MPSSEDNFCWTTASGDSSSTSSGDNNTLLDMDESDYGKPYKKKLQAKLNISIETENGKMSENKGKNKKKKIKLENIETALDENINRSIVKSEPESDIDVKKKNISETLDFLVKMENSNNCHANVSNNDVDSFIEPYTPKKLKKRKRDKTENKEIDVDTGFESSIENDNISTSLLDKSVILERKRKKKKRSINESSEVPSDTSVDNSFPSCVEHSSDDLKMKSKKKKRDKDVISCESEREMSISSPVNYLVEHNINNVLSNEEHSSLSKVSFIENKNNQSEDNDNFTATVGNTYLKPKKKKKKSVNNSELLTGTITPSSLTSDTVMEENIGNKYISNAIVSKNITVDEFANRTQRIPDKIIFDDGDINSNYEETLPNNSCLTKYVKQNNQLIPITTKLQKDCIITESDEIWIIRCPTDVNINDLNDANVSLNSKSKVKLNGRTYDTFLEDCASEIALLSSENDKFVLNNIKVNGTLRLRKRIPKQHINEDRVMVNAFDFIPLPETKCRHPFFGINYKQFTKLPSHVSERLKSVGNTKNRLQQEITPENSLVRKKKKRKHKLSEEDTSSVVKKKRKREKEHNESEVWESEKAIEENLFNF